VLRFKPIIRDAFEFFDPIGLGGGASKSAEEMNMVVDPANFYRRTIELFGNSAEILMEAGTKDGIAKEWAALFGGEDQVDVNSGKGLWHWAKMT